ncbi:hypothetical protein WN51_12669 [Melipona quadrifasciata]|uniref:Uncharacterized protein n=1 Tax=Melipona quadrifasciata TaxID=166423 RepID=A0A0M9A0P3_9HYME|nr:hypothetical protein WN51_12669 [Melipona quadrifasciata]
MHARERRLRKEADRNRVYRPGIILARGVSFVEGAAANARTNKSPKEQPFVRVTAERRERRAQFTWIIA